MHLSRQKRGEGWRGGGGEEKYFFWFQNQSIATPRPGPESELKEEGGGTKNACVGVRRDELFRVVSDLPKYEKKQKPPGLNRDV